MGVIYFGSDSHLDYDFEMHKMCKSTTISNRIMQNAILLCFFFLALLLLRFLAGLRLLGGVKATDISRATEHVWRRDEWRMHLAFASEATGSVGCVLSSGGKRRRWLTTLSYVRRGRRVSGDRACQ
jgi:hypothetical protein